MGQPRQAPSGPCAQPEPWMGRLHQAQAAKLPGASDARHQAWQACGWPRKWSTCSCGRGCLTTVPCLPRKAQQQQEPAGAGVSRHAAAASPAGSLASADTACCDVGCRRTVSGPCALSQRSAAEPQTRRSRKCLVGLRRPAVPLHALRTHEHVHGMHAAGQPARRPAHCGAAPGCPVTLLHAGQQSARLWGHHRPADASMLASLSSRLAWAGRSARGRQRLSAALPFWLPAARPSRRQLLGSHQLPHRFLGFAASNVALASSPAEQPCSSGRLQQLSCRGDARAPHPAAGSAAAGFSWHPGSSTPQQCAAAG